jgi:hypothetical protein
MFERTEARAGRTTGESCGPAAERPLDERVHALAAPLGGLLAEAERARRERAEARPADGGAVCAWNHFENIPTFYNWNNRPR